jgi:hypothetical protein
VQGGSKTDPFFNNVKLLIHFDGDDNGTSFPDVTGKIFTRAGTTLPVTKTGVKQAGTASGFFGTGGAASSYLTTPDSVDWAFLAGDYTIECFYYPISFASVATIMGQWNGGFSWIWQVGTNGRHGIYFTSGVQSIVTTNALTLNQWNFIAISKMSGAVSGYVGAVRGVSVTNTTSIPDVNAPFAVGANFGNLGLYGGQNAAGYIDELRITKGIGRYSGETITVPSTPFPDA